MTAPSEWPFFQMIYTALQANSAAFDALSTNANGLTGIYDHVPQDASDPTSSQFPFITCGDIGSAEDDDKTADGLVSTINFHVYSRFNGRMEVLQIMDEIRSYLHHNNTLSIPAVSITLVEVDRTIAPFLDPDQHTYHGVVRMLFTYHTS